MFNYNEVRPLKNGEEFYFSFQDFSGNLDFEELIKELQNKSVDWLINRINELARMRKTHKKGGKDDSSGKAGQYKMMVGKHVSILDYNRETRTESRNMKNKPKRGAWKTHSTGNNTGWQVLTTKTGRVGFSEMSGKSLLIIGVTIMDNVTEDERVSFYRSFYNAVGKHFPEMLNDLIPPSIKD